MAALFHLPTQHTDHAVRKKRRPFAGAGVALVISWRSLSVICSNRRPVGRIVTMPSFDVKYLRNADLGLRRAVPLVD